MKSISKVKNTLCLFAMVLAVYGTRLAHSGETPSRVQIQTLAKLSKLEKKKWVNPILENLTSALENNQDSLPDVALRLNQLVTLHKTYQLDDRERQDQLEVLLEESKAVREKFRGKLSLPHEEKMKLFRSLDTEKIDSKVLEIVRQYEPGKNILNLYGVSISGGLGYGGVGMDVGAGTSANIFGKRDLRLGVGLGLLSPAVGAAVSCGKVIDDSEVSDKMIGSVKNYHTDFALGVGFSSSKSVRNDAIRQVILRRDTSVINGFSIGYGGGEGERRFGIVRLPIRIKRDYLK
jgi:hypothetical protein